MLIIVILNLPILFVNGFLTPKKSKIIPSQLFEKETKMPNEKGLLIMFSNGQEVVTRLRKINHEAEQDEEFFIDLLKTRIDPKGFKKATGSTNSSFAYLENGVKIPFAEWFTGKYDLRVSGFTGPEGISGAFIFLISKDN